MHEWDTYIQDKENKTLAKIEQQAIDQALELSQKRNEFLSGYHKFVFSKKYCDLKA